MNVLVLTGAGVSAESGIATFRDADGLWEGHRVEDVATPQGFRQDPALVHDFYNQRRRLLQTDSIAPNAAHASLAQFERRLTETSSGQFLLVTQNIDDLHTRAGSRNVLAMHGQLLKARCTATGKLFDWLDDLTPQTPHPDHPDDASKRGLLRPHVVWFGETPLGLDQIAAAAANADLFIAIGTSGLVYPAAGIVQQTRQGCRKIEISLDDTPSSPAFDETIRGRAGQEVPRLLQSLG